MVKRAVIVGVDQYRDPLFTDLRYAEEDAWRLRRLLEELPEPFDKVIFLKGRHASDDAVLQALEDTTRDLDEGDLFLFYFSGHGVQQPGSRQQLLLCPQANPRVLRSGTNGTLPLSRLDDLACEARYDTVFILDTCRNMLLQGGKGIGGMKGSESFKDISAGKPSGRSGRNVTLWSCADGQLSQELSDYQGGVFTLSLVKELRNQSVLDGGLLERVALEMSRLTGMGQSPQARLPPEPLLLSPIRQKEPTPPPEAPPPEEEPWFVAVNGRSSPAIPLKAILSEIRKGRIRRGTMLWSEKLGKWTPAGEIGDLQPHLPTVEPPEPPREKVKTRQSQIRSSVKPPRPPGDPPQKPIKSPQVADQENQADSGEAAKNQREGNSVPSNGKKAGNQRPKTINIRRPGSSGPGLRKRVVGASVVLAVLVSIGLVIEQRSNPIQSSPESPMKRLLPHDLVEITNAKPAPLSGLAPGSREAQERQMAQAEELGLPLEVKTAKLGMRFRLVPSGEFLMGSTENEQDAIVEAGLGRILADLESPQTRASLPQGVYVGKYEVTQEEWERVMESNPSFFQNVGPNMPVESVSWNMAQKFLRKLCELEGVPEQTYRLLTEAEWEYACRAGTSDETYVGNCSDLENPYSYLNEIAVFLENSDAVYGNKYAITGESHREIGPQLVGQKKPNAWGIFDMLGNVNEWTSSSNGEYLSDITPIPKISRFSVRGGSFNAKWIRLRSSSRGFHLPADSHEGLGLRVLRDLPMKSYAVRASDTLASIANKFDVTAKEIKAKNKLGSDRLLVGQVLSIPE